MITKVTFSTVFTIAFICIGFTGFGFANSVSANPAEAILTFKYRSNGSLAINVNFDSEITSRCIVRHRSSLYYEGDVLGDKRVLRRSTISRTLKIGRKSTSLRATNLPGAKLDKNGSDPILAVQARLVCSGEEPVNSNIEARFIICGADVARVSLPTYLSTLKRELKKSQ